MVARKTIELHAGLADMFAAFCGERGLIEKRVVAAAILMLVESTPKTRDDAFARLVRFETGGHDDGHTGAAA